MAEEREIEQFEDTEELQLPTTTISSSDVFDAFQQLTYRRPRVARIVQLYLTGVYSTADIAEIVNVSKDSVLKWLRRQEIKEYIAAYQAESLAMIKNKMASAADKAFDNVVRLLESELDQVSLSASKDILDRTGFKPVTETKSEVTVISYEEKLKDALSGTIDVEYEVVEDEVDEESISDTTD